MNDKFNGSTDGGKHFSNLQSYTLNASGGKKKRNRNRFNRNKNKYDSYHFHNMTAGDHLGNQLNTPQPGKTQIKFRGDSFNPQSSGRQSYGPTKGVNPFSTLATPTDKKGQDLEFGSASKTFKLKLDPSSQSMRNMNSSSNASLRTDKTLIAAGHAGTTKSGKRDHK